MEIIYKGKVVGNIKDETITFDKYDLNPFLDENTFDLVEEEDEMGNIVYVKQPASVIKKMVLLKELGFEFKE
jgi:hypothetical protein